MKEFKENNLREVMDKMFEIAGHEDMDYDKAVEMSKIVKELEDQISICENSKDRKKLMQERNDNTYYLKYTITEAKEKEYIDWLIKYLIKELKFPKAIAEKKAPSFILNHGLKTAYVEKSEEIGTIGS